MNKNIPLYYNEDKTKFGVLNWRCWDKRPSEEQRKEIPWDCD